MATAGLYDDSGKWLYHTGLPAKSGVGGGLIAASPGKFGIAAVSPPLDGAGNKGNARPVIAAILNALGATRRQQNRRNNRDCRKRRARQLLRMPPSSREEAHQIAHERREDLIALGKSLSVSNGLSTG